MFTGIVETTGRVVGVRGNRLTISSRKPFKGICVGESISVDGVCLTVENHSRKGLTFRLLPETRKVATLGILQEGDRVNLERALRVGDRLGGHLLLGHVDGTGKVVARRKQRGSVTLEIEIPPSLAHFLVPKGPIGIDGVSLTLGALLRSNRIQLHLVKHTLKATTLGSKQPGSRVNIEVDLIAKYVRGML